MLKRIPLRPTVENPATTASVPISCAALICTAGCPADITEKLAESLPDVCFDCYSSEVTSAQNICPYKDIYLLISAEDIIGIEEDWLNTTTAFKGISLKERNVFIQGYRNELLSPDWEALLSSFASRGALPVLLESAQAQVNF